MGISTDWATGKSVYHEEPGMSPDYNEMMKQRAAAKNGEQAAPTGQYSSSRFGIQELSTTGPPVKRNEAQAAGLPAAGLQAASPAAAPAPSDTPELASSTSSKSTTTTTGGGGGSPQAGGSTVIDKAPGDAALSGLTGALGELSGGGGGGGVGLTQANSTVGFSGSGLRAGLGTRTYPQDTYALAQLRKAY